MSKRQSTKLAAFDRLLAEMGASNQAWAKQGVVAHSEKSIASVRAKRAEEAGRIGQSRPAGRPTIKVGTRVQLLRDVEAGPEADRPLPKGTEAIVAFMDRSPMVRISLRTDALQFGDDWPTINVKHLRPLAST